MSTRYAFMPISTYPEPVADSAVLAASRFAAALGFEVHVRTYSVDIPEMHSPLGSFLLDIPGLVRAAEEKSKAECQRLKGLLENSNELRPFVQFSTQLVPLGSALDKAAAEARYYDISVLPWSGESVLAQDMSEAVVFGSGRPAILVPPTTKPARPNHLAIAWDASRVAARALGDSLSFLPEGSRISVLTVKDEKQMSEHDIAGLLASSLEWRGFNAKPCSNSLGGTTISEALQAAAMAEGAQLLAMGAFGHSRLRDFVLGGATKGVLSNLRLPVLLSH